jgi:hypothetical protein
LVASAPGGASGLVLPNCNTKSGLDFVSLTKLSAYAIIGWCAVLAHGGKPSREDVLASIFVEEELS